MGKIVGITLGGSMQKQFTTPEIMIFPCDYALDIIVFFVGEL